MTRSRNYVGELPKGWAWFHYPDVSFVGDKVYLTYLRGTPVLGVAEQKLSRQDKVLRIYPLEWFYR